jgi:hypothetical protein
LFFDLAGNLFQQLRFAHELIDDLRVLQHPDGVDELLVYFQGITETWMAAGAPWPPTDLIA